MSLGSALSFLIFVVLLWKLRFKCLQSFRFYFELHAKDFLLTEKKN